MSFLAATETVLQRDEYTQKWACVCGSCVAEMSAAVANFRRRVMCGEEKNPAAE